MKDLLCWKLAFEILKLLILKTVTKYAIFKWDYKKRAVIGKIRRVYELVERKLIVLE